MPSLLTPAYRLLATRLSPAGKRARLSILIYHRVAPVADELMPDIPTVQAFDAQLRQLTSVFTVLPLHEAVQQLHDNTLPARAACITFDDGYADNVIHALPVLQRHGVHATFFIATAYLNGGRMFNDSVIEAIRRCPGPLLDLQSLGLGRHTLRTPGEKISAIAALLPQIKYLPASERVALADRIAELAGGAPLPDDLMMSTAHLKTLHAAGMGIGGHTATHPILAGLPRQTVCDEILAGKRFLEETLGQAVRLFAYPNGKPGVDYAPAQAGIVRDLGFDAAVSTQWGSAHANSDRYQLPRFTPWSRRPTRFIPMLLSNLRH